MADVILPSLREGGTIEQKVQNLTDNVYQLKKELEFLLQNIDSINVTSLNTNITKIKSDKGTTEIKGPLLVMKDKQAIPVLRLKMGYDEETGQFVFTLIDVDGHPTIYMNSLGQLLLSGKPLIEMYDENDVLRLRQGFDTDTGKFVYSLRDISGIETFSVTDTGQLNLSGKPLLEMYDNQAIPVLRLRMGFDPGTDKFVFNMFDEAGVETIGISADGKGVITGGTVIGGTIKTATSGKRIELSNNSFKTYDADGNLEGLVFGAESEGEFSYGDLYLYADGVPVARFYNTIDAGYSFHPLNGKALYLGAVGANMYATGNWGCLNASFSNLNNNSVKYALESYVDSYIAGLQSQINSLEARVVALEAVH